MHTFNKLNILQIKTIQKLVSIVIFQINGNNYTNQQIGSKYILDWNNKNYQNGMLDPGLAYQT